MLRERAVVVLVKLAEDAPEVGELRLELVRDATEDLGALWGIGDTVLPPLLELLVVDLAAAVLVHLHHGVCELPLREGLAARCGQHLDLFPVQRTGAVHIKLLKQLAEALRIGLRELARFGLHPAH